MNTDKYPKLNLKNKIIASSVGFLALIIVLIYFIVVPTIKDIKTMGREIENQRIDLENKYLKGQSLKQLTENLNKIEPRLALLDQIFINQNRELEFITSLENQASLNRVKQKINLSAPQTSANQNFQKTVLQLFTKGSFTEQLRYLISLESLNYYINVKRLELSPAENELAEFSGQLDTSSINMFLGADTYWN